MKTILKGLFKSLDNLSTATTGNFEIAPIPVQIKLEEFGKMPEKAHDTDAGYDLYANIYSEKTQNFLELPSDDMVEIPAGSIVKISVGFSAQIPEGYVAHLYARSGLSTKKGLMLANGVGVCDSSYRGTYIVALYNDSGYPQYIEHGERIAQMTIDPVLPIDLIEVNELDKTERGQGGFGSSGEKQL